LLKGKTILITGGTGSFGTNFTSYLLSHYNPKKVIIYSRDEYKQYLLKEKFKSFDKKLRFFIGDVRDKERLKMAFDNVDYVVHAAALKQVPACEYNPIEAVKTNIQGAQNIIEAAIEKGVKKVIALSTDKAVNPINLYGATKLVSDKLFIAGNAYAGAKDTIFSIVRYGNVPYSRGSVIPLFMNLIKNGETVLPITDYRMTRFWIFLSQEIKMVIKALNIALGGEIFISKLKSYKIVDLARTLNPEVRLKEVGIREGEKIHEILISEGEIRNTYEYKDYYIVYPEFKWWNLEKHFHKNGKKVDESFKYTSNNPELLMSIKELKSKLETLKKEIYL